MLFYRCLMSSQISWGQDSRLTQRHFQLPNKLLDIHKHNLIFTVFAKRKKDVQNIFFNSFIKVPWKLALHLKIGLITIIFRVVGVVLNRPFLIIVVGYTLYTVFENHRKSLIQHCERSELRLHFEWTKIDLKCQNWIILASFWKPDAGARTNDHSM